MVSQQTTTLNCSTLIGLTTMSLLQIMKTVGLAFHLCLTLIGLTTISLLQIMKTVGLAFHLCLTLNVL